MEHPPERRIVVRTRTRAHAPGIADLARQIEAEHRAAVDAAHNAIERASACGRLLIQAKARAGHGQWLAWVAAHLSFGDRQARKYMQLAQHRDQIGLENADLTLDGALALIAVPRRETPAAPTTASDPEVPGRTPAAGAHASPVSRPQIRQTSQAAPAPDHLARLQSALATFSELPKPDVFAEHVMTRQVDTDSTLRDQLTKANQYITHLVRELDAPRR
jgi:hypothetical protein